MAINVSVQQNNGSVPDIILLTQCYYYHRGTQFNSMKRFLSLQPMFPSKRFDNFPPDWGMPRRSRCVHIFLETPLTPHPLSPYHSYNQHLDSKKHKDAVKAMAGASISAEDEDISETDGDTTVATAEEAEAIAASGPMTGNPPATNASRVDASDPGKESAEASKSEEEEKQQEGDEDEGPPPPMGSRVCIFCDGEAASFEENCGHMLREHG